MRLRVCLLGALSLAASAALSGCSGGSPADSSTHAPKSRAQPSIASAVAPAPLPNGILSLSDLVGYAKYRLSYVSPDQYTKEPDDVVLKGRRFDLEINDGRLPLITTYNADRETLDVTVIPSSIIPDSIPDPKIVNYLTIYNEQKNMNPRIMSNSFGVHKEITYVDSQDIGVGTTGTKIGVFKPENSDFVIPLHRVLHISPIQARTNENSYILVIHGEIISDNTGRTIICLHDKEPPTLEKAFPIDQTACVIDARLNSVVVLDAQRHVLVQWGVR